MRSDVGAGLSAVVRDAECVPLPKVILIWLVIVQENTTVSSQYGHLVTTTSNHWERCVFPDLIPCPPSGSIASRTFGTHHAFLCPGICSIDPFKDRRNTLSDSNAHGGQPKVHVAIDHSVNQSGSDPRAAGSEWVPDGDRSAANIYFVLG